MPTLYDAYARRVDEHEAVQALPPDKRVVYITTGIRDWDRNGGLERGVETLIAMPSGDGKSHVAHHLVCAAARGGHRSVLFSFEDPEAKTADRGLASLTGVNSGALGREDYDSADVLPRLRAALRDAEWARLVDLQVGLRSPEEALEYCESGPGRDTEVRVYDYAQAFNAAEGSTMERTLANFAWEANVQAQRDSAAVVAMAQTVPEVELRGQDWFLRNEIKGYPTAIEGYRPGPGKHDVSWCKALYERSKCAAYGWRPGRWARKHRMKGASGKQVPDDRIEFWFDKVSFGNEGCLIVGFDGAHSRLYDLKESKA